jgi:hypothetical protein
MTQYKKPTAADWDWYQREYDRLVIQQGRKIAGTTEIAIAQTPLDETLRNQQRAELLALKIRRDAQLGY